MAAQPMTAPETQVVLNLSMSYGPILVGAMLSCITWGISCMQIFIYHMTYEDDRTVIKLFVFFVWLVDTANQILLMASLWPALILRWGSLAELSITQPTLLHRVWVSAVIAFAVQMFFLGRIFKLSNEKWKLSLLIILLPPSLFQLVASIPWEILAFQENHALSTLSTRRVIGLEIALRASGTFVDIAIATAMVYFLHKQRRSTFFVRSKKMIHRLIVLTVVTGLWTAIAALVDFILVAAFPQGLLFCIVELPFSSLYVNSLLANLNARQFLRQTDVELSSLEFYTSRGDTRGPDNSTILRSMPNGRGATVRGNPAVAIRVDTSHIVDTDYTIQSDKAAAVSYY